jgi:Domain of unknown function (DUF1841)
MLAPDRTQMRRVFIQAWRKHLARAPLEPLEQIVAEVIRRHPEHHRLIEAGEPALERDFLAEDGDTNPFLHMGLHISIQEQIASDRPAGIRDLHRRLVLGLGSTHEAEHRLMECLGQSLWEAQRGGRLPDEQAYLACARRLLGEG